MLLMFTTIRKIVTRSAILPGIIWTGIKNPINEMMRSIIQGKYVFIIIGAKRLFSENLNPATETFRFLAILSNMVSLMNSLRPQVRIYGQRLKEKENLLLRQRGIFF